MKRTGILVILLVVVVGGSFLLGLWGRGDSSLLDVSQSTTSSTPEGRTASGLGQGAGLEVRREGGDPQRAGPGAAGRRSLDRGLEGEIQGRVLDLLSDPIAGATLWLHSIVDAQRMGAQAPVLARTESDGQGRFRLRGLELGMYSLRVSARGHADKLDRLRLTRRHPKRLGWVVHLGEGHEVSGIVVDPSGQPVPGAWVLANDSMGSGEGLQKEMRSDAQGRFAVTGLPSKQTHILAWAEGFTLGIAQTGGSPSPLRVQLKEPGPFKMEIGFAPEQEGDAPKPDDVSVRMSLTVGTQGFFLPGPLQQLRVPSEGTVVTRGLCEGSYTLVLNSLQAAVKPKRILQTLTPGQPEKSVKIDWQGLRKLSGKVVWKNGTPARGIVLQTSVDNNLELILAKSDQAGRFTFSRRFMPAAETIVFLATPGLAFEKGAHQVSWQRLREGEAPKTLTLLRPKTLSGRVVDAGGKPVVGAQVWLHPRQVAHQRYGQAISDERGEFHLAVSRSGEGMLVLDAKDNELYCPDPVFVTGQGTMAQQGFVVRLVKGAWIEGRVVDDEGAGVQGVRFQASYLKALGATEPKSVPVRRLGESRERKVAWSNREGRFRIVGVPEGRWKVIARLPGRIQRTPDLTVIVVQGKTLGGLKFVLGAGLSIGGRLVTQDGKPIVGFWISATFDGNIAKGEPGSRSSAQSGVDGSFLLTGLRPGNFKLQGQLPRKLQKELGLLERGAGGAPSMSAPRTFGSAAMAGTMSHHWEIRLPRFGGIRARLAQTGAPLQRIEMELRSSVKIWSFDLSVKQGAVSMKRVLAGTYQLRIKSPRMATFERKIEIRADQVTDLGLLPIELLEEVEGHVTDAQGKAIAGVWISLDSEVTRLWPQYDLGKGALQFEGLVLSQSDMFGRFRVPKTKGSSRIFAFKPGYAPATLAWGKPAKSASKAKSHKPPLLVLERRSEISVQSPVSAGAKTGPGTWYAQLSLVPITPNTTHSAWAKSLQLEPGKRVRFLGLAPGRYRLQAINLERTNKFRKKTVPGESYYEEFQVSLGSKRLIKIR